MKATGIVRRIDDLGRVVIPKEIRRTLRIREGDPLEIFTDKDGEILLRKYSPIGDISKIAQDYTEALSQTSGYAACVTDMDRVIASHGITKKNIIDRAISTDLENVISAGKTVSAAKKEPGFIAILDDDILGAYKNVCIAPIVTENDELGAVILLSTTKKMGEAESKLAENAANFLARQMHQ